MDDLGGRSGSIHFVAAGRAPAAQARSLASPSEVCPMAPRKHTSLVLRVTEAPGRGTVRLTVDGLRVFDGEFVAPPRIRRSKQIPAKGKLLESARYWVARGLHPNLTIWASKYMRDRDADIASAIQDIRKAMKSIRISRECQELAREVGNIDS